MLYARGMNAAIIALCLSLALVLSAPAPCPAQDDGQPPAKTASKSKSSSKSETKSKSKSKSKSDKKQNGDKSSKSKKKDKSERAAPSGSFRGIAWGTPLSAFSDMTLLEDNGQLKYYAKTGDDMRVEGVAMREVAYAFCKGAFAGVLVRFDGEMNRLQYMARLGDRLGTPIESAPNVRQDRSWRFSDGKEEVILEYSTVANTGAAAYSSTKALTPCMAP